MKKLILVAALTMASVVSAQAQRSSDPNDPNAQPRTGTRPQRPATPTGQPTPGAQPTPPTAKPATPPPAPVVTRPVVPPPAPPAPVVIRPVAPPPVIAPKIFMPPPPPPRPIWSRGDHPYQARHHRECQEKSHRLHSYERHAADDGYISPRERRNISELRRDLDRTCGGFRWRG